MTHETIQNPHLEGSSFLWSGNEIGVLLFHGFTATTAEVRLLGRVLHQAGYTVAGPLLPGHGSTPEAMNQCRWRDWTGAAEDAYQKLAGRCKRVLVGGESMGSLLALFLASEHTEIAGVLAFAPALRVPSRIKPLLAPLLAPIIGMSPKPAGKPSAADPHWQGYTVNPAKAAAQLFRLQRQVRMRLARIHQPLLIVHGRLDTTVDPAAPETLYRSVGSTLKELHWLDQSGHCVILDRQWEQAAALAEQFVQRALDTDNGRA